MNLAEIVSAPWAIQPAAFQSVIEISERHLRGEPADLAAIEAKLGRPLDNSRAGVQLDRGVAVISVEGILAKRANLLTSISGGTSTQIVSGQFAQAVMDPSVAAIVLAIDSPGGTVDGTQALADQIFAARGRKPIVAVCDGIACSAAYWIGSACDAVFVADDTTQIGSIGVIAQHVDRSAADSASGLRVTNIVAGKFKDPASPHQPLSTAGREIIQAQVDEIYAVFLGDVARNRGISKAAAHERMGDGRIFLGRQAMAAGLVDDMRTLPAAVAVLLNAIPTTESNTAAVSRPTTAGDIALAARRLICAEAQRGRTLALCDAVAQVTTGGN